MIYECNSCQARFHDIAQNRSQQRDGICPSCGAEDITDIREELLERIRVLSGREAKDMLHYLSGLYDQRPEFWVALEAFLRIHKPVVDLSECKTGTEAKQKLAQVVLEEVSCSAE